MYIQNINDFWYDKTNFKNKYSQNFKGNIIRNVGTFKLGTQELLRVSDISGKYRQLDIMFRTAGSYMTDLFKKGIGFLIPLTVGGFALKNTLNSEEVPNVTVANGVQDNPDTLMTFAVGDSEDVAKLVVSKDGTVNVLADEDLLQSEIERYASEINNNHDKFFETIHSKTSDAINSIGEIINRKEDYQFDITSEEDVRHVARQFIDEKKRLALLANITSNRRFYKEFAWDEVSNKSVEKGVLKDKDISFSFSHLENFYFNGMQITVTDEKAGTKQGFVANADGKIYKSKVYKKEDFVPRKVWHIRNLKPVSAEELQNPDLQYMFNYGYSHVDKAYKYMLKILYDQNKEFLDSYSGVTDKKKNYIDEILARKIKRVDEFNSRMESELKSRIAKSESLDKSPLWEDRAKTARVYNLTPAEFEMAKKFASYSDQISTAYLKRMQYQRPELNEKCGFMRRKSRNGVIFKNMLRSDKYYLGMAQYMAKPETKELISFGIFDKKLREIARFKISNNGEAKLITRPATPDEVVAEIEQMMKTEMENGLPKRLTDRLETAVYYHENKIKVDTYIERSFHPITLAQAVKELRNSKNYYKFDTEKLSEIKDKWENIRAIYRDHQEPAYKWQKFFFPDVESSTKKYMYGRLDEHDINYEFIFIDNEHCSGLRILTRNDKGIFQNGYVIENDGNVYKLMMMPDSDKYRYLYVERPNFSQLDAKAVKAEHVDLIVDQISENITKFNDFCNECANYIVTDGKMSKKLIIEIVRKYRPEIVTPDMEIAVQRKPVVRSEKPEVVKRKPGRPRKNPVPDTPKEPKKLGRPRKEVPVDTTNSAADSAQIAKPKVKRAYRTHAKSKPFQFEYSDSYAHMLKPNGEFKPLVAISIFDIVEQLNKLFALPYEERSPHLIHDLKSNGEVFTSRISCYAPDGAYITVSVCKTNDFVDFLYYSMRVQKGNEIMYFNINPEKDSVLKCDDNNILVRDKFKVKQRISKADFVAQNPLSVNMPMYLAEIFAVKPDEERKTVPFQKFETKRSLAEKQAMRDFERAMHKTSAPNAIQKELDMEFDAETEDFEED